MQYNRLGNSGLIVSELSFGSWVTFSRDNNSGTVNGNNRKEAANSCFEIMKAAYLGGVNLFDNAEAYCAGDAERLMGDAVRMGLEQLVWTREDLVLTTKIMFGALPPKNRSDYIPKPKSVNRIGLSRKHVVEGLKASLKRMQLDYIDLVFCHRPDPIVPMEEIVRGFNHVLDQGLAFYWGTSEWSATQLMEAKSVADRLGLIPPLMDQPEYSLFHRQRVEVEYKDLYRKDSLGLGLTVWSPLSSGILTGKYGQGIPPNSRLASKAFQSRPDFQIKFIDRIKAAESLRPIAKRLGCNMGQLSLAWCLNNPDVSTVITGATSVAQVEENLAACEVKHLLTNEIMKEIENAIGKAYKPKLSNVTKQMSYRTRKLSSGALSKL
jgi:voltage-dependent potassium channel beta subunit